MWQLPRRLHAGSWWLWAVGLVVAATQTRNPLLLGLIIAVSGLTVAARRTDAGWARGYRAYLVVALAVIAIRVVFRILLGGDFGSQVMFTLPRLSLPGGGVSLGGAVTLEEMLAGLYDGLRLGTIVVCVGAANTLADPRRLAGGLPRALGALATSVVVALSLAPQLVESLLRVRRARRLRGETGAGWRSIRTLLVPVLEDALHRSLALAASMDSRGYGRWSAPGGQRSTRVLLWFGSAAICAGMFGLLSGMAPAAAVLATGLAACAWGLYRLGQGVSRTRYRPDRWASPEWIVSVSGLAAAAGLFLVGALDPGALHPALQPPAWPSANLLAIGTVALAAAPALAAPALPRPARAVEGAAS